MEKKKDKRNRVLSNLRFKRKLLAKARQMVLSEDQTQRDRINALANFLGLSGREKRKIKVSDYDDYTFTYGDEEYMVLTDSEADDRAVEEIQNIIDDTGLQAFSSEAQEYILDNFCSWDWESDLHDGNMSYAYDVWEESDDEYGNHAIREFYERTDGTDSFGKTVGGFALVRKDNNIKDEDPIIFSTKQEALDFINERNLRISDYKDIVFDEKFVDKDYVCEQLAYSMDDVYTSASEYLRDSGGLDSDWLINCLDVEAITQYCIEKDGRGHNLARYDGYENEIDYEGETYFIYRMN